MKSRASDQDMLFLIKSPNFQKKIKLLRKRLKIPVNGFASSDDFFLWDKNIRPTFKWDKSLEMAIISILDEFNMDPVYGNIVGRHLTLNEINMEHLGEPKVVVTLDPKGNFIKGEWEPKIILQILPTTRLKDIKEAWSQVKELQKEFNPKKNNKSLPTSERDLRILQLDDEGEVHKEIRKIINHEFPDQKVDEASNIGSILFKVRKRMNHIT